MSTVADDPRLADAVPEPAASGAPQPPTPPTPPDPASTTAVRAVALGEDQPLTKEQILRPAFGALSTTLGCAFLVGGMFTGITPRLYAAVGGIVGVFASVWAARARKRVGTIQALSLFAVVFAGMFLLLIGDPGALGRLGDVLGEAASNARLRRPPAPFDDGWRMILPVTVGFVGYAAAWIGSMGRKPALGVLLPIPIIAFSAIAQPSEAQIPAGIVAFATFVIGLAVIYRADRGEGEGVSMAYELKRAARTAPLMLLLIAVLAGLSQTGFLFPQPLYDPTQRAQLPKSVPLSGVQDRVLFSVQAQQAAQFTGPWRAGVLDVYDGESWRLPAFASSKLQPAPTSGLIDEVFGTPIQPKLRARIVVGGLEGTVLPLPARTKGIIVDRSPPLVLDKRTESVRVEQGQIEEGLGYDVVFGVLPKEDDLRGAGSPNPDIREEFLDVAGRKMPDAIRELLDQFEIEAAKKPELNNAWDRLDFLRSALKETVTLTGAGLPEPVPPSKIQDMFDGSKEASPFEYVAAQALIARWAGVPSRIGYGFDKGEKNASSSLLEYRPRHGASWLEVYFQGYGWIPVTGLPKRAKASTTEGPKTEGDILPSDEILIEVFIPLRDTPSNALFKQIQKGLLLISPFALTFGLTWLFWPAVYKSRRRSRRRQWALQQGRSARIAVAYTELRDMATDLGVGDPYATPLAYLRNVVPDEEHRQLAWLVTRTLWGDLREAIADDDVFAAEELSRSVRRRLYEAQPFTIRFISLVSRLSLRNPYAPELLSPPVEKFELRRALGRLNPWGRKRKKEKLDEIVETA